MTKLLWDQVGARRYNSGVSNGVLYLPDGSAVAWNGLTAVDEDAPEGTTPLYLDGLKYLDVPGSDEYSSTLKAYTYPDQFMAFDGRAAIKPGLFVGEQTPTTFGLSYQTGVGTDLDPSAYKIHILYGLTATPDTRTYSSIADQTNPTDFSWRLTAIPQVVTGYAPTAHAILDSTRMSPYLLESIKNILYGTETLAPSLPTLDYLINYAVNFHAVVITDNGDGTWTATGPDDLVYTLSTDSTQFVVDGVDVVWAVSSPYTSDTFRVSST